MLGAFVVGYFLVWLKYAELPIAVNTCTAEPVYWPKHVGQIPNTSTSVLLCEEPSAATIVSEVKYATSLFNSNNVIAFYALNSLSISWNVWNGFAILRLTR